MSKLKDGSRKDYLYLDMENKLKPIPEYFWKIVNYPENNIAIIGINEVSIDKDNAVKRSKEFCSVTDCPKVLVQIKNNTPKKGFIFCCEISDDFLQKIQINISTVEDNEVCDMAGVEGSQSTQAKLSLDQSNRPI